MPLPDRSWSACCLVEASFEAVASDETSLDCFTLPSSPLLQMRTGLFVFSAPTCLAEDAAPASWPVKLDCPAAWIPTPDEQPHLFPPVGSWSIRCFVEASFEAAADDVTLFDCLALPPSPLLQVRT